MPAGSLSGAAPPRGPAFFNPRARLSRDVSVAAYAAFFGGRGPGAFLEGQSGLGARGLRVANEVGGAGPVVLNDANPSALALARESAALNGLDNVEFSQEETCRFMASRSGGGLRGAAVDVDPFGSPARYLDCCLRATAHGGMLSATATDLHLLGGVFPAACRRRYGGSPMRCEFGREVGLRLVLGCLRHVAARLDLSFRPLLVHADQHYYRAYVRVMVRPDGAEDLGFLRHCPGCGERGAAAAAGGPCGACGGAQEFAGPLWTGPLFDRAFAEAAGAEAGRLEVDRRCAVLAGRAAQEAGMPAAYYTLDGVASRMRSSPPGLGAALGALRAAGHRASPTSLDPAGFRTDAGMRGIAEALR